MSTLPLDHQNLFNARLIARSSAGDAVPPAHQQVLSDWAEAIRSGAIRQQKEQQIRSAFVQKIFCEVLGYTTFGSGNAGSYSLADESYVGKGRVDVVLGQFGGAESGKPHNDRVLVPLELKGPNTSNLDVMMPGRFKSPVQQVWEYAMDTPHAKFLLLTNMLEIRLYAVGYTRRVYERFDLLEIADNPAQFQRMQLLLGVNNLLGGRTLELLNESGAIEKQITRELYADYKRWRIQLIIALAHANPIEPGALIAPVQKLLDRILFVAFAQQRGLLPAGTLKSVHTQSGWKRVPLWENYQALFRAVDIGLPERGVPPYNGGLFAPDAVLDHLTVPDAACSVFQEFAKYDLGGEISVNVLGHIFEQSISDLEELQELANTGAFTLQAITAQANKASSKTSVSGARKEHGIVYTPEFITAFIVDQTLGKTLDSARADCVSSYQNDTATGWRKPTAEEKRYAKTLAQPERVVELLFWRAWLAELVRIKVCDPACGSGAFLVAVFDVLRAEYASVNEQIAAITGSMDVFNANKEILNSNLYGVDLNAESIEITKLSLWLKTAQYGKPLESLEAHLRVGNSLLATNFDWTTAFPEVTAQGGFDVLVGNPPYVRQERIGHMKPYLEQHFSVFNGAVDLYAYFFEQGIRLLRPTTGRLGFISSSTFFKTGSGENLRRFLVQNVHIETVVDFGDLQVFEGVTTYAAIVTLRKGTSEGASLRYWKVKNSIPVKFKEAFADAAQTMQMARLGATSWQFEGDALALLRDKLINGHPTLKEVYGSPYYGIKTGLNEAFVLNRAERDALIAQDPHSAALLKPFLEGKDLKKWRVEPQDKYLLQIPSGSTLRGADEAQAWALFCTQQSAIARWLKPFEAAARKRSDQGEFWWELRACAYYDKFDTQKLVYVDMSDKPNFSIDTTRAAMANTGYFVPNADYFLLALMVSKPVWFLLTAMTTILRGGFYRLFTQHIETFPIPPATEAQKSQLASLAKSAQAAAQERFQLLKKFNQTAIRDFAPSGKMPAAWGEALPSFSVFTAELKKRFQRDLNLQERNDWNAYLAQTHARIRELEQTIAQSEYQINTLVGELFGLSDDELRLLQNA